MKIEEMNNINNEEIDEEEEDIQEKMIPTYVFHGKNY